MLPKEDPELRRAALLRRRAPRRQTHATVSKIPAANPGKNPTSTAAMGKSLQFSVTETPPLDEPGVAKEGGVGSFVLDEEGEEDDGVDVGVADVGEGEGFAGAFD